MSTTKMRPRNDTPMRPRARVAFGALLLATRIALAQSGGGYDLHWNTQQGGGGTMSGASGYTLTGTVGQPDASPAGAMTGAAGYSLLGGFWHTTSESDVIFRDGFE